MKIREINRLKLLCYQSLPKCGSIDHYFAAAVAGFIILFFIKNMKNVVHLC